jgi:hypothetical protein
VSLNSSAFDSYLYLLGPSGSVVASDDDSGGGTNSLIRYTVVSGGTYTIEATSYYSISAGTFTLALAIAGAGTPTGCTPSPISNNQTLSGTMSSSCASTHRSGKYAKLYTFSANANDSITVSLNSSAFDSYLYLLGPSGSVVASDDDSGGGTNSLIRYTAATGGTYTIEATSYSSGSTGSFALGLSVTGGGGTPTSCSPTAINTNQTLSGTLSSSCASAQRPGRYAKLYTFNANANDSITVALNSSAFDAYLYLSGPNGTVVAHDDDSGGGTNSLIRYTAAVGGSYTIEATSYSSSATGSFSLALTVAGGNVSTNKSTIFIIHGISQFGGANVAVAAGINGLAATLRSSDGVDQSRFTIDANFDYGSTCPDPTHPLVGPGVSCDTSLCTIPNLGHLLAIYINRANPQGDIILIGYSLGGLVARDMLLNNYSNVVTNRRAAALITLGTPNVGYPYDPIDDSQKCSSLVQQMSSDFRTHQADNTVDLSSYLYGLDVSWGASSFPGLPRTWMTAAGRCCTAATRTFTGGRGNGCPDYNVDNDGVVCEQSAAFRLNVGNIPTVRWLDSGRSYSHTGGFSSWFVLDSGSGTQPLFNPLGTGDLIRAIRTLINGL